MSNVKQGDIARITCKPNQNRLVSVDVRCGCYGHSQNHPGVEHHIAKALGMRIALAWEITEPVAVTA